MSKATSTVQIDGREVIVTVDLESGLWSAVQDSEPLASAATRDVVIKKARGLLRRTRVRLSIPGTLVDVAGNGKPLHVIVTGLHAQNGDILYQAVDDLKKKGRLSLSSWSHHDELCPRLTDEELTEFVTLRRALEHAAAAFERWQRHHVIEDSEQFVQDAIEAQVEQGDET